MKRGEDYRVRRRIVGFTLTEMLMAAALLALIGSGVLAALNNGTMLWQKITRRLPAQSVNLFFERIASDLRGAFLLGQIPFEGSDDKISFPVVMTTSAESQGIGRAGYVFDRNHKIIDRQSFSYSGVYRKRPDAVREILRNVQSIRFSYFYYDPNADYYGWTSVWPEEGISFDKNKKAVLPVAVKIELGVLENDVVRDFTKTVFIPAGCCRTVEK